MFKLLFIIAILVSVIDDAQTYVYVVLKGRQEKNKFIRRLMNKHGRRTGFWIMCACEIIGFIAVWLLSISGLIIAVVLAWVLCILALYYLTKTVIANFKVM